MLLGVPNTSLMNTITKDTVVTVTHTSSTHSYRYHHSRHKHRDISVIHVDLQQALSQNEHTVTDFLYKTQVMES